MDKLKSTQGKKDPSTKSIENHQDLIMNKKPKLDLLLIDDETKWMNRFINSFNNFKYNFERDNNIELTISPYTNYIPNSSDEDYIPNLPNFIHNIENYFNDEDSFDLQGILLDWELNGKKEGIIEKRILIEKIKSIRPEIPIFILSSHDGFYIMEEAGDLIDEFFNKPGIEDDIISLISKVVANFNNRRESPFYKAYKDYIKNSVDSWHTPGHSNGKSFRKSNYIYDFYQFFEKNVFSGDLSVSVEKLGSLLDSTAYIKEAQNKAANTFGAKSTYFVTNGSSTSNKIIIQTVLKPGDKVLVDRNCHKSVHYGIIQSGAIPVFMNSEYSPELGIFAPPKYAEIKAEIEKGEHKFKLLILTGSTYEGILSDIKPIVDLCHNQKEKVKVFIDEAWFAYSRFHPKYINYSAVQSGADYVTHSSHKTLSAFSQSSMIHINDEDFDADFFREIFYIYTSTSPQYQMIASLDVAATQMRMEGFKLLYQAIEQAEKFRGKVEAKLKNFNIVNKDVFIKAFPHLKREGVEFDKLKVLIDFSQTGLSEKVIIKQIKEKANLEIEKSTHSTFLVLFTIGIEEEKVVRLFTVLKELDRKLNPNSSKKEKNKFVEIPKDIKIPTGIIPSDIFYGSREKFGINKTVGKTSAGLVTPYPPGIPLLVPGQIIEKEHIEYLKALIKHDVEIHGLFENNEIYITK